MRIDTAIVLAAIVLVLLWPTHQQLTIRALRHAIRQQHKQLHQHRRAIVQLQSAAIQPPTSTHAPMNGKVWSGSMAAIATAKAPSASPTNDPDQTLRLARPPALSDIEHALTEAGRALTATELATRLGRQTWDLIADIDRDMAAGRIRTVPGHTAGRTAYQLADTDTLRMPRGMPLLPGTVAR